VSFDPSWPENEKFDRFCDALEANPIAIPVAAADKLDNFRDIVMHLRLGVPVFSKKFLNRDPYESIVQWLTVIAACSSRALKKDRRRVTLMTDEAVNLLTEMRRLALPAKSAHR
jgi:hypothetical protein